LLHQVGDLYELHVKLQYQKIKAYRLLYVPPGLTLKNSARWLLCIYVFCVALRRNSNLCLI